MVVGIMKKFVRQSSIEMAKRFKYVSVQKKSVARKIESVR